MAKTREEWTEKEIDFLISLKKAGIKSRSISEKLKEEFGTTRTSSSINTLYSNTVRGRRVFGGTKEGAVVNVDVEDFNQKLVEYDKVNLRDVLQRREDFLYNLMSDQANAIRRYDFFAKYEKVKFEDLMTLDSTKRREITRMLENPSQKPDLRNIAILYRKGPEVGFSLVLPIHFVESKGVSEGGLTSCLNDSVLGTMFKDLEFAAKESSQDRFRDLVKYNFGGQMTNPGKFGTLTTGYVRREHGKVERVYILEDKFGLPVFSETE